MPLYYFWAPQLHTRDHTICSSINSSLINLWSSHTNRLASKMNLVGNLLKKRHGFLTNTLEIGISFIIRGIKNNNDMFCSLVSLDLYLNCLQLFMFLPRFCINSAHAQEWLLSPYLEIPVLTLILCIYQHYVYKYFFKYINRRTILIQNRICHSFRQCSTGRSDV